jgi:hypothetical protein
MIDELDAKRIEEILGESGWENPLPSPEDRKGWGSLLGKPTLSSLLEEHEKRLGVLGEGQIVQIPLSLYLNYERTGSRAPHDGIMATRRSRLMTLVFAELAEGGGEYLDPIMDHIWAICEESSWVIPAHARSLPVYSDIEYIDLVSAGTALTFGETLWMLGTRLDAHEPGVRSRMEYELGRRCWDPYLAGHDLYWRFPRENERVNNWNAVCNCGVVGSAILALDDDTKLARMIEICLRSLNYYLASFDPDGGSDEGPSYWAYGFSNYVWLSYLLETRTAGVISLMDAEEVRGIALFPQRVTLNGNSVVNFSDCGARASFPPSLLFYLASRLQIPEVEAFAAYQYRLGLSGYGRYLSRELVWMPDVIPERDWVPDKHIFYPGQQWMVSRVDPGNPGSLILAAKGGNNGENHNQNDVGAFIVHLGGESLVADLGRGTYTREYFGPKRYDILVNSSRGHNVPLVNDVVQSQGSEFCASVIDHSTSPSGDLLEIEISGAYPSEAGLTSLVRRLSLSRDGVGSIILDDKIAFRDDGNSYRCPLYTWNEIEERPGTIEISGEGGRLAIDYPDDVANAVVDQLDLQDGNFGKPVNRITFEIEVPGKSLNFSMVMKPI